MVWTKSSFFKCLDPLGYIDMYAMVQSQIWVPAQISTVLGVDVWRILQDLHQVVRFEHEEHHSPFC